MSGSTTDREPPVISLRPSLANDLFLLFTGGFEAARQTLEELAVEGEKFLATVEGERLGDLLGIGGPWNNRTLARLLTLVEQNAKKQGGEVLAAFDLSLGYLDRFRRDPTVQELAETVRGPDPGLVLLGLVALRKGPSKPRDDETVEEAEDTEDLDGLSTPQAEEADVGSLLR